MSWPVFLVGVGVIAGLWAFRFTNIGQVRFAFALAASSLACFVGSWATANGHPTLAVAGAIGVGAAVMMLIVAPMLARVALAMAHRENFGMARRALDVAALLSPGARFDQIRASIDVMASVAEHGMRAAVAMLDRARAGVPQKEAIARRMIEERMLWLWMRAGQWDEAIAHADQLAQPYSPNVWAELAIARAMRGEWDAAVAAAQQLAAALAPSTSAGALLWVRVRLAFAAACGLPDEAERLVQVGKRWFAPAHAAYWLTVAEQRAAAFAVATKYAPPDAPVAPEADVAAAGGPALLAEMTTAAVAARAASSHASRLAKAAERDAALRELQATLLVPPPRAPSAAVLRFARELASEHLALPQRAPRLPIGGFLAGVLGLAFVAAQVFVGGNDSAALVASGGGAASFIAIGQYWRFVTASLVHVSVQHLAFNAIAMWALGRMALRLFGARRTAAIALFCGVVGVAVTYAVMPVGTIVGASSATLGLAGACIVGLWMRPAGMPVRAASRLAWLLSAVVAVQVLVDVRATAAAQWPHLAGLGAGVVAGGLWGRRGPLQTLRQGLAHLVLVIGLAALGLGLGHLTRVRFSDDVLAIPLMPVTQHGVAMQLPNAAIAESDGDGWSLAEFDVFVRVTFVAARPPVGTAPTHDVQLRQAGEQQVAATLATAWRPFGIAPYVMAAAAARDSSLQTWLRGGMAARQFTDPLPYAPLAGWYWQIMLEAGGQATGRVALWTPVASTQGTAVLAIYAGSWFVAHAQPVLAVWRNSMQIP